MPEQRGSPLGPRLAVLNPLFVPASQGAVKDAPCPSFLTHCLRLFIDWQSIDTVMVIYSLQATIPDVCGMRIARAVAFAPSSRPFGAVCTAKPFARTLMISVIGDRMLIPTYPA
eukprot:366512-Chlamydomonas_euryale.AAC.23